AQALRQTAESLTTDPRWCATHSADEAALLWANSDRAKERHGVALLAVDGDITQHGSTAELEQALRDLEQEEEHAEMAALRQQKRDIMARQLRALEEVAQTVVESDELDAKAIKRFG